MHLTHGLHRSLQQTPDAPATISGDRVRTFSEHADRVARVAGGLRDLGVSNGERVAILSQNSDRYCELLNAVPWSDGILNPVNIRWSASEITYSLVDSETAVLVVDEAFVPIVPQLRDEVRGLRTVVYAGEGAAPDGTVSYEELAEGATPVPDAGRRGDDVAAILYTGGTTGFPKGVMLTHANLLTGSVSGQAMSPIAAGGGRVLHAAPLFHLFALAGWMAQSTIGGAHVVVPRFDPLAVLSAIEANRVTTVGLVPTMLQLLVDHPEREAHDTSSLRFLYYGGSAITDAVLRRAMVAFPDTDFVQAYGMTEVAPITLLTADDHRRGRHLRSAGRALVNTEVRIVDGDGNEAARGTVGEIVARGGQLMTGYWGSPEQTSTAIRDGWMHTGDVGSMDEDGYVSIVDRLNDMIITGGENVYSTEVEDAVGRHPAVATCAVVGRPDTRWGERVHALVVLRRGSCVSVDELQDHTRRLIAGYKTPRTFEFVESLPTSGAGKVLKRELRTP